MQHTPGPWRIVSGFHPYSDVVGPEHKDEDDCQWIATVHGGHLHDFIGEANARLIAAAPAMYEALSPFAARYDRIKREEGNTPPLKVLVPFSWLEEARAALAAARGEES